MGTLRFRAAKRFMHFCYRSGAVLSADGDLEVRGRPELPRYFVPVFWLRTRLLDDRRAWQSAAIQRPSWACLRRALLERSLQKNIARARGALSPASRAVRCVLYGWTQSCPSQHT